MMKRTRLALIVCAFALVPAVAQADNGGWLDWLYSLDAKLLGYGTEVHLLCLNEMDQVERCEEWYGLRPGVNYRRIKHEIDFRIAYYHNYGERFSDLTDDTGSVNALKLMVMYHFHPDAHLAVGFGAGFAPFWGSAGDKSDTDRRFDSFTRGVLSPISIIYGPFTTGNIWKKSFIIRAESSYITQGFSGALFGNTTTRYDTHGGEWNFSIATGFDFRRR